MWRLPGKRSTAGLLAALVAVSGAWSRTAGQERPPATQTASTPLTRTTELDRRGLARIANPPLGLPAVPTPRDNPPSAEKIRLGRRLFFDRRLSRNGTLSCGMCHVPEQGFTVNEIQTAVGNEGKSLRRNAPTLLNVAYSVPLFHDGREPSFDLQPFDVFLSPDEMAAPSIGALVATVRSLPGYEELFHRAFGGTATVESIGQALGTYMRTLLAGNSPFDRWYFRAEADAVSDAAKRGFALFSGRAGCTSCHLVGRQTALLSDGSFHDTGVGWYRSMVAAGSREPVRVAIAPGEEVELHRDVVRSVETPLRSDLGRYEVTLDPNDRWRYKTPSLRNVAVTGPYMHDGSLSTLRQVLELYNRGGYRHDGLDSRIAPLGLKQQEVEELLAFLHSLTSLDLDELVLDARSEPVGNPGDSGGVDLRRRR